jgi:hypothetical protein
MDVSEENFYIKYDKEKGYSAFAAIDLNPGDVVLTETPIVTRFIEDWSLYYCHNCLKECSTSNFGICSGCYYCRYCSYKCQNEHWVFAS